MLTRSRYELDTFSRSKMSHGHLRMAKDQLTPFNLSNHIVELLVDCSDLGTSTTTMQSE